MTVDGLNINQLFNTTLNDVSKDGQKLSSRMEVLAKGENLSQEQMVQLQFEVGQYNAKIEALATVTKAMTDMLKSLAQRAN